MAQKSETEKKGKKTGSRSSKFNDQKKESLGNTFARFSISEPNSTY